MSVLDKFLNVMRLNPDDEDDYYNEESESKNIAEVIIAKNRSGSVGTAEMLWMSNYTKFANIEHYRDDI